MAEPGPEEPDERLLLLSEPAVQDGSPERGLRGVKAAPGGAVRLGGLPGLEKEDEDVDSEGDGEEEPLLGASVARRNRTAGTSWDRETRIAAGLLIFFKSGFTLVVMVHLVIGIVYHS